MGRVVSREATTTTSGNGSGPGPTGTSTGNGQGTDGTTTWTRFALQVQAVYKRGRDSKLRKGTTIMHVSQQDLTCKCPKIKTNK